MARIGKTVAQLGRSSAQAGLPSRSPLRLGVLLEDYPAILLVFPLAVDDLFEVGL